MVRSWVADNKNKNKIMAINFIVRKIVKTTNYDNPIEVSLNSKRVRRLHRAREKLYLEGMK